MSTSPSQVPPPPPPTVPPSNPPSPPTGKRVSPLLWVLVGCGVLLVLVAVALLVGGVLIARKAKSVLGEVRDNPAMVVAKAVVAANPEVELVSADDDAGTITVRNKKTGELLTVDLEEAKRGKFTFTTGEGKRLQVTAQGGEGGTVRIESEEGEMTFGEGAQADIPEFLPVYPGMRLENIASARLASGATGGSWRFTASASPQAILDFYRREMEGKGFQVTVTSSQRGREVSGGLLHATADGGAQVLTLMVGAKGGGSEGTLSLEMKSGE
ncbi:MAG: hypothetical protein HXY19_06615 [Thermoanaerobaculaceae bacterium]|nr:hypothetical protein [Thermoanaerobaculaceae bacterium]